MKRGHAALRLLLGGKGNCKAHYMSRAVTDASPNNELPVSVCGSVYFSSFSFSFLIFFLSPSFLFLLLLILP
jgi:hypothetical protein